MTSAIRPIPASPEIARLLKLKARYTGPLDDGIIGDSLAESIIRDPLALDPEARASSTDIRRA
jgi:hypothetical protein